MARETLTLWSMPRLGLSILWFLLVAAIATATAACGSGLLRTEPDAIAAARRLSRLSEPIRVLSVAQGLAGDIFNGPMGAVPDDMIAATRARRARPAWDVVLSGFVTEPCADSVALPPCGFVIVQLVLDRETGEVLYRLGP
ncbi:MAG TPA: hypothetical protein VGM49_00035 [Candidatus Limnocylindrales bacterium]|jgi:hypothetical protein